MALPRLILTGASGFIGRHLLDAFKEEFRIVGLARRSQLHCGAPVHNNITWYQVDIGDKNSLERRIPLHSGVRRSRLCHPPRGSLRLHRRQPPRVHANQRRGDAQRARGVPHVSTSSASSSARRWRPARFPNTGEVLTETNPPDGDHVYAVTKRIGEEMLAEYDDSMSRRASFVSPPCSQIGASTPRSTIFLETWLSNVWNSNGSSAAAGPRPYPTCTSARWARSSARSSPSGRLQTARDPDRQPQRDALPQGSLRSRQYRLLRPARQADVHAQVPRPHRRCGAWISSVVFSGTGPSNGRG